ncbi:MAG: hypothetical protein KHX03_00340 [Clostridium sp.]|nr:hypothetical protein [Clostridium sp.]
MNIFSKNFSVIILLIAFLLISYFCFKREDSYEVLKVINASEFFVDLNKNKICDEDEHIALYHLNFSDDRFSKIDNLRLSYLADFYAKNVLLGKKIKIEKDKSNKEHFILCDNSDYELNLIKYGYAITKNNFEVVKKNINYAKTLNLVSYNSRTRKVHSLDCKFALNTPNAEIIKFEDVPKDYLPCRMCRLKKKNNFKKKEHKNYARDVYEKYRPSYKDDFVEFYVTDFTKYYYPSSKCLTTACQSLLKQINSAKSTIDFAIYGVDNQPEITNALISAQNRGVKVRWVYDIDKKGNTIYLETVKLKKVLTNARPDTDYDKELFVSNSNYSIKDSIMHNKFFIFDSKKVWTGSANISHTDLSGFNANSALFINSSQIARIYQNEFEQMYNGRFHSLKLPTKFNTTMLGSSVVEVYFSPQDAIMTKHILPLINSAKRYVYVPVFVITHKDFNQALINAKNRGVDVKVIVDATAASGKYSSVKFLRENGIKVKVENRAGKMHMKSIIIDDVYSVIGSMNFSKSGEKYNDENVLIIKNANLSKSFKKQFLHFWNSIPDKWLFKNPGAESFNSINSCFDGVDNDFDGKIDMEDEGCNFRLREKLQPSKK